MNTDTHNESVFVEFTTCQLIPVFTITTWLLILNDFKILLLTHLEVKLILFLAYLRKWLNFL